MEVSAPSELLDEEQESESDSSQQEAVNDYDENAFAKSQKLFKIEKGNLNSKS